MKDKLLCFHEDVLKSSVSEKQEGCGDADAVSAGKDDLWRVGTVGEDLLQRAGGG